MKDSLTITGRITFRIYARFEQWHMRAVRTVIARTSQKALYAFLERYGTVRDTWAVSNLIVNAGKAQLALLAGDASATPFTYLAVGTSSTSPAAGQTALGAEISGSGLGRAAATVSRTTTSVTNDTLQLLYLWTVSGSQTIEEIGIFNAASVGTMLGRALTSSKSVVSGETVTGIYTVQFA